MRLAWVHYPMQMGLAMNRGYLVSGFYLYNALRKLLGGDLVDAVPEAPGDPRLHLHYCPPHFFRPVEGRINVLFSMWEAPLLPPEFQRILATADRRLVPSRFCADVWREHGLDADVVPLGIPDAFLEVDPSRPVLDHGGVRFLWVGSNLERKGWPLLAAAWREAFAGAPAGVASLRVKTIRAPGGVQLFPAPAPVLLDTRDLEPAEMVQLYLDHDVYIHTAVGEGFGLTALEAMASGCLVMSPIHTGLMDFLDSFVAVRIPMGGFVQVEIASDSHAAVAYRCPYARPKDFAPRLQAVARSWGGRQTEEIRQAGVLRARRLTWAASAGALIQALEGEGAPETAQPAAALARPGALLGPDDGSSTGIAGNAPTGRGGVPCPN